MIPDGIYDNLNNNRRELYCYGKSAAFINAKILLEKNIKSEELPISASWRKPWKFYPPPPIEREKDNMITIKKKIEKEVTVDVAECPYCFMECTKSNMKEEPCLSLVNNGRFHISCGVCGADGPATIDYEEAVERWNKIAMIVKSYMRY